MRLEPGWNLDVANGNDVGVEREGRGSMPEDRGGKIILRRNVWVMMVEEVSASISPAISASAMEGGWAGAAGDTARRGVGAP